MPDINTRPAPEEVFATRGKPGAFLQRENYNLNNIENTLDAKSDIVIVGPSQTGKSIFIKDCLSNKGYEFSELSRSIKTIDDFKEQLLFAITGKSSLLVKESEGKESRKGWAGKIKASVPLITLIPGLRAEGAYDRNENSAQTTTSEQEPIGGVVERELKAAIDEIRDTNGQVKYVLVDDFHEIKEESARADIVRFCKELHDREGNTIRFVFVSIYEEAVKVFNDAQYRNRFPTFDYPGWEEEDLAKVLLNGFRKLNLRCTPTRVSQLAKAAIGNPLLVCDLGQFVARRIKKRAEEAWAGDNSIQVTVEDKDYALMTQLNAYRELRELANIAADSAWKNRVDIERYDVEINGKEVKDQTKFHLILEAMRRNARNPKGLKATTIAFKIAEECGVHIDASEVIMLLNTLAEIDLSNMEYRKSLTRLPINPFLVAPSADRSDVVIKVVDPTVILYLDLGGEFNVSAH